LNNKTKRHLNNNDKIITTESVKFNKIKIEKDATFSLFGIEIKEKMYLNNVKFKNVKVKYKKLD